MAERAHKATRDYRGVVMHSGQNHPVVLKKGDVLDVEEWLADLVNQDVPGTLERLTVKRASQYKATTKKGTSKAKASKTRQVAAAEDR